MQQYLQNEFLNQLRTKRVPVTIFMTNGFRIEGTIVGFDKYMVALRSHNKQQILYKQAISTIQPEKPISVETE